MIGAHHDTGVLVGGESIPQGHEFSLHGGHRLVLIALPLPQETVNLVCETNAHNVKRKQANVNRSKRCKTKASKCKTKANNVKQKRTNVKQKRTK
jgi:hypothetical protein